MVVLLLTLLRFIREIKEKLKNPEFQALGLTIVFILLGGTIFYHHIEHWSYLDSFYFSVVTLSTIGYGDFVPTTSLGKLFTTVYIFIGVGAIASFITLLAKKQRKN